MTALAKCSVCDQPLTQVGGGEGVCLPCLRAGGPQNAEHGSIPGHDLLDEISRGGMGVVYRALQHQPRRIVALKMLLPGYSDTKGLQERFRVEAAAMAQMNHPGILPLYQFGDVDGLPYFTMKLAAGGSLAQRMKTGQKITARQAAAWVASLAATLHYAHQHGILHRDIKPANILFDESGTPCLADFGLAKLAGDESGLTRSTHVMGTPCYLPPEVAMNGSKASTTASDVYSLGAVFYELLAGRPPFVVEGMAALIRKIADEMPESPSTFASSIPKDLEIICLTCLAKQPARRFGSAGELAADLNSWLEGRPILARRFNNFERLISWARRKPALASLSAMLVVSILGGGVVLWWKNGQLQQALVEAQQNRTVAEQRSEFLLGNFADTLEDLGRVDLLDLAWENLDATQRGNAVWSNTPASRQLLVRWSHALLLQGRSQEAEAKARQAVSLLLGLNAPAEVLLARKARIALVEALADGGRYEQAMAEIEALRTLVPADYPGGLDRASAETDLMEAEMVFRQEKLPERMQQAQEKAKSALNSARRWSVREPQSPEATFLTVRCLRAQGRALYYARDPASALSLFIEARDVAGALSARSQPSADWREAWADLIGWVGTAQSRLGQDKDEASESALVAELNATSDLLQGNPRNVRLRLRLADCHAALDGFYKDRKRLEEARPHSRERVKLMSGLFQDAPHWREVRISLLDANLSEAGVLLKESDETAAGARIAEALTVAASVLATRPRDIRDQKGWREATLRAAELWQGAGHPDQAMRLLEDAVAVCSTRAAEKAGEAPWWQWSHAFFLRRQAEAHRKEGQMEAMLEKTREALHLRVELLTARWELDEISNEVPSTYLKIGQVLTEEGRIAEALASAREALKCWTDHGQETTPLHDWLSTFHITATAACEGRTESAEDGKSFAREVIGAMEACVEGKILVDAEKQHWEKLRELAGNPPSLPKASMLREDGGRGQPAHSIRKNLPPNREVILRLAEVLGRPGPGALGESRQQQWVLLEGPRIAGEILRTVTEEAPDLMRDQVLQMVAATTRDQRHHPAEHRLHHGAAPAFLESRAQVIDQNVQGIEEGGHGLARRRHQIPALIIEMLRPARGQLIAPSQNPVAHRIPQPQPLVTQREIIRELVGIRTGNAADGERLAGRFGTAHPEGELRRVDVVAGHHPLKAPPARPGQRAMPRILIDDRCPSHGGPTVRSTQCPRIARLQHATLRGGNVEHPVDESEPHGLQLTIEMPHHFTAPDHPQAPPQAGPQHAILEKESVAQGNGPALTLLRQILRQRRLHPQPGQEIQPQRVRVIPRIVRDHRDVVFARQQPQRMHELRVRSPHVGRPVEPVNAPSLPHHPSVLSANHASLQS